MRIRKCAQQKKHADDQQPVRCPQCLRAPAASQARRHDRDGCRHEQQQSCARDPRQEIVTREEAQEPALNQLSHQVEVRMKVFADLRQLVPVCQQHRYGEGDAGQRNCSHPGPQVTEVATSPVDGREQQVTGDDSDQYHQRHRMGQHQQHQGNREAGQREGCPALNSGWWQLVPEAERP